MDKKENKKEDINIRLTTSLKKQYKIYCLKNSLDMSKHIRDFIEKTLQESENN
jgi:hypothetical protein